MSEKLNFSFILNPPQNSPCNVFVKKSGKINDDFIPFSPTRVSKGTGKSAFPADASIIQVSHVQVGEYFSLFYSFISDVLSCFM